MEINDTQRKTIAYSIIIIILVTALFFILKPVITGYNIYQKVQSSNVTLDQYITDTNIMQSNLQVAKTNATSCYTLYQGLLEKVISVENQFSECKSQLYFVNSSYQSYKSTCNSQLKDADTKCQSKLDALNAADQVQTNTIRRLLNEKTSDYDELKSSYDAIVQNSANNICCKAKVDNPNIASYTVSNDKIICLETGDKAISC